MWKTSYVLFSINISFPTYCWLVLNSWHFLGDIFNLFFNKGFNRSSNLFTWASLDGVNSIRSSMIVLQYFLLWRQFKIALMYDCHIDGEMFNPIAFFDMGMKNCQNVEVFCNISLNFLTVLKSGKHLSSLTLIILHILSSLTLKMCP